MQYKIVQFSERTPIERPTPRLVFLWVSFQKIAETRTPIKGHP